MMVYCPGAPLKLHPPLFVPTPTETVEVSVLMHTEVELKSAAQVPFATEHVPEMTTMIARTLVELACQLIVTLPELVVTKGLAPMPSPVLPLEVSATVELIVCLGKGTTKRTTTKMRTTTTVPTMAVSFLRLRRGAGAWGTGGGGVAGGGGAGSAGGGA